MDRLCAAAASRFENVLHVEIGIAGSSAADTQEASSAMRVCELSFVGIAIDSDPADTQLADAHGMRTAISPRLATNNE